MKKMKIKRQTLVLASVLLVVAAIVVVSYVFLGGGNKKEESGLSKETLVILKKVGRHMILPEESRPTVAIVKEPELLKEQFFFARAEVGDAVLIYPINRKAILYRPSVDKIIEVAPLLVHIQSP